MDIRVDRVNRIKIQITFKLLSNFGGTSSKILLDLTNTFVKEEPGLPKTPWRALWPGRSVPSPLPSSVLAGSAHEPAWCCYASRSLESQGGGREPAVSTQEAEDSAQRVRAAPSKLPVGQESGMFLIAEAGQAVNQQGLNCWIKHDSQQPFGKMSWYFFF